MNLLEPIGTLQKMDVKQSVIALLFAAGEPISLEKLADALDIEKSSCITLIEEINREWDEGNFALTILPLNDSVQLVTRKCYTPKIQKLLTQKRNTPPSQAALEILSIIAYNQPVTRNFIEQVRGVECGATIGGLVDKGLVEEAGRLELPGRPISYRTTENFLRVFGLSKLEELPDLHIPTEEK